MRVQRAEQGFFEERGLADLRHACLAAFRQPRERREPLARTNGLGRDQRKLIRFHAATIGGRYFSEMNAALSW
jgi:hypothetical protein